MKLVRLVAGHPVPEARMRVLVPENSDRVIITCICGTVYAARLPEVGKRAEVQCPRDGCGAGVEIDRRPVLEAKRLCLPPIKDTLRDLIYQGCQPRSGATSFLDWVPGPTPEPGVPVQEEPLPPGSRLVADRDQALTLESLEEGAKMMLELLDRPSEPLEQPRPVHIAYGNRLITVCGCGREIVVNRPVEGDTSRVICETCGLDQTFTWPPRTS